ALAKCRESRGPSSRFVAELKSIKEVEAENRRKYSGDGYDARTISRPVTAQAGDYASRMLELKVDMVSRDCPGDVLIDLCCGAGEHLRSTAADRAVAVGVDF